MYKKFDLGKYQRGGKVKSQPVPNSVKRAGQSEVAQSNLEAERVIKEMKKYGATHPDQLYDPEFMRRAEERLKKQPRRFAEGGPVGISSEVEGLPQEERDAVQVQRNNRPLDGSSPELVKEWQRMLNQRGYNLSVDGKLGNKTYAALRDLQSKDSEDYANTFGFNLNDVTSKYLTNRGEPVSAPVRRTQMVSQPSNIRASQPQRTVTKTYNKQDYVKPTNTVNSTPTKDSTRSVQKPAVKQDTVKAHVTPAVKKATPVKQAPKTHTSRFGYNPNQQGYATRVNNNFANTRLNKNVLLPVRKIASAVNDANKKLYKDILIATLFKNKEWRNIKLGWD